MHASGSVVWSICLFPVTWAGLVAYMAIAARPRTKWLAFGLFTSASLLTIFFWSAF